MCVCVCVCVCVCLCVCVCVCVAVQYHFLTAIVKTAAGSSALRRYVPGAVTEGEVSTVMRLPYNLTLWCASPWAPPSAASTSGSASASTAAATASTAAAHGYDFVVGTSAGVFLWNSSNGKCVLCFFQSCFLL